MRVHKKRRTRNEYEWVLFFLWHCLSNSLWSFDGFPQRTCDLLNLLSTSSISSSHRLHIWQRNFPVAVHGSQKYATIIHSDIQTNTRKQTTPRIQMKRRNKILLIGFSATLRARWTNESVNDRVKKLNIHLRWQHTHTPHNLESQTETETEWGGRKTKWAPLKPSSLLSFNRI